MCIALYIITSGTGFAQLPSNGGDSPASAIPAVAPLTAAASTVPALKPRAGVASGSLASFDPFMDNHLAAPSVPQGVFGMHVREVEKILRAYGAKPHSYAFGKQSRMLLAVYMITIQFDRTRKVGAILIEPISPFKKIEASAQTFFTQLFMRNLHPGSFRTLITQEKISISYDSGMGKDGMPAKEN